MSGDAGEMQNAHNLVADALRKGISVDQKDLDRIGLKEKKLPQPFGKPPPPPVGIYAIDWVLVETKRANASCMEAFFLS